MKKYDWLHRSAAKSRRRFGLKSSIFGLLSLALIGFSSCDERSCGEHDPEPRGICNTLITVEENSCWQSSAGNFWFRTDQGKLLMPTASITNLPELKSGMRLKIGYKVLEENPQNATTCNFLVAPEMPALAIAITCAEPIGFCGTIPNPQNCNLNATAETVVCGAGVWANVWLRLDDGTLLQPWETSTQGLQLVNGQRYKIGYELMQRDNRYQNAVICQAVPPAAQAARITCIQADSAATLTGK